MKELNDCKIIRDLFPSYIDGLTNETTNQYIEEHLKDCEDCKKALENMKKDIKLNTTKKSSDEVNYIKKFNKKMRTLKIILTVILLIFLLSYIRNIIIVVSLNNKVSKYTSSTNYYMRSISHSDEDLIIIENYKKDDRYIRKLKVLSEISRSGITDYCNGETVNSYANMKLYEDEQEQLSRKTAQLNKANGLPEPLIPNYIEINHPIKFFILPLVSTITSEKCNGKDCYKIEIFNTSDIYYIDKETGLTIRISTSNTINNIQNDMISDIQYEFNTVTDEDFIEPDISEYEIEE